jgi:hypothetical protein
MLAIGPVVTERGCAGIGEGHAMEENPYRSPRNVRDEFLPRDYEEPADWGRVLVVALGILAAILAVIVLAFCCLSSLVFLIPN